ncbi:starch-binding protein [Bacteroidia bacterium]|nr:starch-binding protein [Bacteroidia bacterium]
MKNIIKITIIGFLACFASSCKDFLEAPAKSTLDESVIFSNVAQAENAINGVLVSFAETNSYRGRFFTYYGINNDVEVYNSIPVDKEPDDKVKLVNYNTNTNNDQMNTDNNVWAKLYEAIERANLAIRGLKTYADFNNKELAQIYGELLTLRALIYHDLLRAFGNVPARFEPITPATTYVEKSDRDVVLKQLLADLDEAAKYVGWPNENRFTTSTEHVNKCFTKGLRARLALIAGGYSLHNGETTARLSTDPDLNREVMYAIAKQECLDVINSGHAYLQSGGFEAVFRALHAENYVAGNEIFWELPFSEGRGRVIFDLGVKHTNTDKYTGQAKGGANGPNPLLFYTFRKEDVRRDVSVVPYEWTGGKQVPTNLNKWYFGKYRYEWLTRMVTSTNDDGLNFIGMRYADVLLMAAEAINELDGPAAAAPYLQQILERAYPNNLSIANSELAAAQASKEAMFNAIVDQRGKEFVGELIRKHDLIRWNLLDAKMAENKANLEKLANRTAPFDDVNTKVYYKTAGDGESLIFYGLNRGELGAPTENAGSYSSKDWKIQSNDALYNYWDRLYARTPSLQPYWPIWQTFIDKSNGTLVNDPIFN